MTLCMGGVYTHGGSSSIEMEEIKRVDGIDVSESLWSKF